MAIPNDLTIILSLPGSGIPDVLFAEALAESFDGLTFVQRSILNLKRVRGRGIGGGVHVAQPGIYAPKMVWSLVNAYLDKANGWNFRSMVLAQQTAPYRGEVILTDYNQPVTTAEAAYAGRTALESRVVEGVTQQFFSTKVFLQIEQGGKSDDGSTSQVDITKPFSCGYLVRFDAIEM